MVKTGLELLQRRFPKKLKGKRIGLLCHAPSIMKDFRHAADLFYNMSECRLTAIFGPQHGLYGQTQDNMIEWKSTKHPIYNIPLFSLYGKNRKPSREMLEEIDALVVDIQDVGARLYTYIWTVKLCMEACSEQGIPVWILDRPNPISRLPFDGPVLKEEFFTFVGGASIPLCHRMTAGELALWIRDHHILKCDLNIIWMKNWRRSSFFEESGIPWVLPSPNMPTRNTASVYPGTVLFEAMNISEARGTTIPFELFGTPFINTHKLLENLKSVKIPGCAFREHNFIPTFNKYKGKICNGLQIHVTEPDIFYPVGAALEIINAIIETSPPGSVVFNQPPYEYEYNLMPFDILSGDEGMRNVLTMRGSLRAEKERWKDEIEIFRKDFDRFAAYRE